MGVNCGEGGLFPINISVGDRRNVSKPLKEMFRVKSIRVGPFYMQALGFFVVALEVGVSAAKIQKNKIKLLVGLAAAISFWSPQTPAQEQNEDRLLIGGIESPTQTSPSAPRLIAPVRPHFPNP